MSAPDAPVFADASSTSSGRPTRRRRRALVVVIVIVVVIAILLVVAELVARHVAENVAEKQIDSSLPDGTTGTVDVSIHGFSVILQALGGHLDDVTLTSHHLVVQKVPIAVKADVTDVPLHQGGTTGPVNAAIVVDQKALNQSKLLKNASGNVALGSGTFSYDSSIKILGLSLTYKLTAKPSVTNGGKSVVLTPTKAAISSSNTSIDVGSLLTYLKTQPPTICIASSLPASATLSSIGVTPGVATFHLHSTGIALDSSALSKTGTC